MFASGEAAPLGGFRPAMTVEGAAGAGKVPVRAAASCLNAPSINHREVFALEEQTPLDSTPQERWRPRVLLPRASRQPDPNCSSELYWPWSSWLACIS